MTAFDPVRRPGPRAQAPADAAAGDPTANAEQQKVKTLLQQMIQALGGDAWLNAPGYELIGRTSGLLPGQTDGGNHRLLRLPPAAG